MSQRFLLFRWKNSVLIVSTDKIYRFLLIIGSTGYWSRFHFSLRCIFKTISSNKRGFLGYWLWLKLNNFFIFNFLYYGFNFGNYFHRLVNAQAIRLGVVQLSYVVAICFLRPHWILSLVFYCWVLLRRHNIFQSTNIL